MILSVGRAIPEIISNFLCDYLIFISLDNFARWVLQVYSRNDETKKLIWRCEGVCLLFTAFLLYWCTQRVSYVLIFLAACCYSVSKGMAVVEGMLKVFLFSLGLLQTVLSYCLIIWYSFWPLIQGWVVASWIYLSSNFQQVSAAVGVSNSTGPNWPRGLTNQGNNLCFINTVFQCLSRIPFFTVDLNRALANTEAILVARTRPERPVAISMAKLLKDLEIADGMTMSQCNFRLAASRLNSTLVSPPIIGAKQSQQDVAEFTMWLLAMLHSALNQNQDVGGSISSKHEVPASMSSLQSIFTPAERQKIDDHRQSILAEIGKAENLEDSALYEPLKKLADFEWEIYGMTNRSLIDQIFTGQIAELHQCVACNRISVHIQNFTLLPVAVPILSSYTSFSLEECLRQFDAIEHLSGKNSLKCECSNNSSPDARNGARSGQTSPVINGGLGTSSGYPYRSLMPPMLMDECSQDTNGECHDSYQRSSTPVTNLKEGRKRTVLCRLPECLIVQLMRFRYDRVRKQCNKVHTSVVLSQNGLDLTSLALSARIHRKVLTDSSLYKYQLYGLCLHEGGENTTYGHYVAFSPDSKGVWYKLEDENVSTISLEKTLNSREVQQNVYLIFYYLKR